MKIKKLPHSSLRIKLRVENLHRRQGVEWFGFLEYRIGRLQADYFKVIQGDGATYVIHDMSNSMRPAGFPRTLIGNRTGDYKGALSMMSLNCLYSGISWVNPIFDFDHRQPTFMEAETDEIITRICIGMNSLSMDAFDQCSMVIADKDMLRTISEWRAKSSTSPCIALGQIAKELGEHFGKIYATEEHRKVSTERYNLKHENARLKQALHARNNEPSNPVVTERPAPNMDFRTLYIMKDSHTNLYKIGKSVNPKFREKTLQSEKPSITMVFSTDETEEMSERTLHAEFANQRVRGEWFKLTPAQVRYICLRAKS